MRPACACHDHPGPARRIVLTGGPGAGKTAVLEVAQQLFCRHVVILPEAASVVFAGGFPRRPTPAAREAAQRAIFHVQHELERMAIEEGEATTILCDRGTIDGLAYWRRPAESFWADVGTTQADQLAGYAAVIHLRPPPPSWGYDQSNPVRVESAAEAAAIDLRLLDAWAAHPDRIVIDSAEVFVTKLDRALIAIRSLVPTCCLRAR